MSSSRAADIPQTARVQPGERRQERVRVEERVSDSVHIVYARGVLLGNGKENKDGP